MRRHIFSGAVVLASFGLASPGLAVTLLNGSFETPAVPAGSFTQYGNGGNIGGWSVFTHPTNAVLAISTTYTEPQITFNAFDGLVALDLTGGGNTGPNGVFQDIATVVGQLYSLSFYLGNAQGSGSPTQPNTNVYLLPSSLSLDITGSGSTVYTNSNTTPGNINWQQFTQNFTATSATTQIRFTNLTSGDNYAGLDAVSITESAVPEPTTWAMMLVGFAAIGFAMRRQRQQPQVRFAF